MHFAVQLLEHWRGLPGQEGAEVLDDPPVVCGIDPAHTRGGALADVAEQAGSAQLPVVLEHTRATRPHGERPGQQIDGFSDGPRVCVGAE